MFELQILFSVDRPVVLLRRSFNYFHDVREFLKWMSCQISTKFPYRIVEVVKIMDGIYKHIVGSVVFQYPTKCKYFPPIPLFLSVKRKRRKTRDENKLYYVY